MSLSNKQIIRCRGSKIEDDLVLMINYTTIISSVKDFYPTLPRLVKAIQASPPSTNNLIFLKKMDDYALETFADAAQADNAQTLAQEDPSNCKKIDNFFDSLTKLVNSWGRFCSHLNTKDSVLQELGYGEDAKKCVSGLSPLPPEHDDL